jgi:hypothetical protein
LAPGTAVAALTDGLAVRPAYRALVLADGPEAYYRLAEASGLVAADETGHGHTGAYAAAGVTYGTPSCLLGDPADRSVLFDGVAGRVDVPYSAALNPLVWSVEAWWFQAVAQAANQPLWDCRPASSGALAAGFDLFLNVGSGLGISVCSTNVAQTIVVGTPPVLPILGNWHHGVATYDGANVRVYVDGVLRTAATPCPYTPNPTNGVGIGHLNIGGNFVAGNVDEVALYPYVLTAAQVAQHYAVGRASGGLGAVVQLADALATARTYSAMVLADRPVAYYRLNEAAGPNAADSAPGGLHQGAITGSGVNYQQPGALPSDTDRALELTGVGSISIADATDLRFTGRLAFSIEAWVKPTIAPAGFPRIWSREHFAPSRFGYLLFLNDAGGGAVVGDNRFDSGAFLGGVTSTVGVVPVGVWTHIVTTFDGQLHRVYINGVLNTTSAADVGSMGTTADALAIGRISSGGGNFTGLIDELAIYPYALAAGQVASHYAAGVANLGAQAALAEVLL